MMMRNAQQEQRSDQQSSRPQEVDEDDDGNNCYYPFSSNSKNGQDEELVTTTSSTDDHKNNNNHLQTTTPVGASPVSASSRGARGRPWYNQRLTIPISVFAVPVEPPPQQGGDLSTISPETWQAFRNSVHTAAGIVVPVDDSSTDDNANITADENRERTTNSQQQEDTWYCYPCWLPLPLVAFFLFIIAAWTTAEILFKYDVTEDYGGTEYIISRSLLIGILGLHAIYRYYWQYRMNNRWNEEHGAGLQAVCDEFSPRFEDECNYYVEYRTRNNLGQVIEFRNRIAFEKVHRPSQPNAPIMTV